MSKTKIQDRIDRFISIRDEFDGYCHIVWLPGAKFDGVLPGAMTDILAAYLDIDDNCCLSFLISDPTTADRDQEMVTFGSFPYSVQKKLVDAWNSIRW